MALGLPLRRALTASLMFAVAAGADPARASVAAASARAAAGAGRAASATAGRRRATLHRGSAAIVAAAAVFEGAGVAGPVAAAAHFG